MHLELSKIQYHCHLVSLPLLLSAQAESLNFGWATSVTAVRQLWHERGKLKPQMKLQRSSSITACQGSASQGVRDQPGSPSGHTGVLIIPNSSYAADPSDITLPRLSSEDKVLLTLYTLNQHLPWDQRLCTPPPMQMWKLCCPKAALEAAPRAQTPGEHKPGSFQSRAGEVQDCPAEPGPCSPRRAQHCPRGQLPCLGTGCFANKNWTKVTEQRAQLCVLT